MSFKPAPLAIHYDARGRVDTLTHAGTETRAVTFRPRRILRVGTMMRSRVLLALLLLTACSRPAKAPTGAIYCRVQNPAGIHTHNLLCFDFLRDRSVIRLTYRTTASPEDVLLTHARGEFEGDQILEDDRPKFRLDGAVSTSPFTLHLIGLTTTANNVSLDCRLDPTQHELPTTCSAPCCMDGAVISIPPP